MKLSAKSIILLLIAFFFITKKKSAKVVWGEGSFDFPDENGDFETYDYVKDEVIEIVPEYEDEEEELYVIIDEDEEYYERANDEVIIGTIKTDNKPIIKNFVEIKHVDIVDNNPIKDFYPINILPFETGGLKSSSADYNFLPIETLRPKPGLMLKPVKPKPLVKPIKRELSGFTFGNTFNSKF
jgi:hypothetical protein